jgi:Na+:H+ antiporter, NhaA family
MNRQRLILFSLLTLVFIGVSFVYFAHAWNESNTRFRTGLPVPRNILPNELLNPDEIIPEGPPTLPELRTDDPLLNGTAKSPLTVVVFGDFECAFCKNQAQAIDEALTLMPRRADIRVVWRDLPLITQHPRALAAATVAQCAARQGKFKQMHDALFFQTADLSDTEFFSIASALQLDSTALLTCLRDPAVTFRLNADIQTAREHAIVSVPMMFINGQPFDGYVDARSLAAMFQRQVDAIAP